MSREVYHDATELGHRYRVELNPQSEQELATCKPLRRSNTPMVTKNTPLVNCAGYLKEKNIAISTLHLAAHGYYLIKFLEVNHNVQKLSHVYKGKLHFDYLQSMPAQLEAK